MSKGSLRYPQKRSTAKSFWQNPQNFTPWQQHSRNQNSQCDSYIDPDRVKRFLSTTIKSVFKNKNRKISLSGSYSSGADIFNSFKKSGKQKCSRIEVESKHYKSKAQQNSERKQTIESIKCKTLEPGFIDVQIPKFKYNVRELTKRREQRQLKQFKSVRKQSKQKEGLKQDDFQFAKQEYRTTRQSFKRYDKTYKTQNQQSQKQLFSRRSSQKTEGDYGNRGLRTKNRLSWFIWTHKLSRSTKLKNLATIDALVL